MNAILYKDLTQLRHDWTKQFAIGLAVIGATAIILLIDGTHMPAQVASPLFQTVFVVIGVTLAPLTWEAFRDDAAEGVIAAMHASGRAAWRYPATRLACVLPPAIVISLTFAAVSTAFVPSLRPFADGGQGAATVLTPALIVAATK